MTISVLDGRAAVCCLESWEPFPRWAAGPPLFSATRTGDELSIVCSDENVPAETDCEKGLRALEVEGPLDFALTGVLAALCTPLANAGIGVFVISTYFTDYVLVREEQLERAVLTLREQGHTVI